MNKSILVLLSTLILTFAYSISAHSHCEIPCGIYDDKARITLLEEHITTMEKSMKMILELEKAGGGNQLIRWVMNKEDHANQFQSIVSQYFLTQRIKADHQHYTKKLELLHQMLVYAMKCKQTTDMENTSKLQALVKEFSKAYFAPHN